MDFFMKIKIQEQLDNQIELLKDLEKDRIDNDLLNVDKYIEEYKVLERLKSLLEEGGNQNEIC